MYCDEQDKCGLKDFYQCLDIVEDCKDALHYGQGIELTYKIEYVVFCYFGHLYMQHKICTLIVVLSWVSKVDWLLGVEDLLTNNVAMLFVG